MIGYSNINESNEIRKKKVLNFVEKDIFIVNNYESAPFKNKNHAIECLIPYHIFQVMTDDLKFKGSDIDISIEKELNTLVKHVEDVIVDTAHLEDGFTPQLLLYHEQRFINSVVHQNKSSAISNKKKNFPNKTLKKIRIKKANNIYVYGVIDAIRIKKAHNKNTNI